ncbi:MAG: hypothetical protein AB7H43_05215 [Acidimicrobiia bacterium]
MSFRCKLAVGVVVLAVGVLSAYGTAMAGPQVRADAPATPPACVPAAGPADCPPPGATGAADPAVARSATGQADSGGDRSGDAGGPPPVAGSPIVGLAVAAGALLGLYGIGEPWRSSQRDAERRCQPVRPSPAPAPRPVARRPIARRVEPAVVDAHRRSLRRGNRACDRPPEERGAPGLHSSLRRRSR